MSKSVTQRMPQDEYYLEIAKAVLLRSTCLRRKYGAVLVNNGEIVATGYNGAPRGYVNCCDVGHCRREELGVPKGERYELCRAIHAEQNAIISAGYERALGGTLYIVGRDASTGELANPEPCMLCRRFIVNSGVERVVGLYSGEVVSEIDMLKWMDEDASFVNVPTKVAFPVRRVYDKYAVITTVDEARAALQEYPSLLTECKSTEANLEDIVAALYRASYRLFEVQNPDTDERTCKANAELWAMNFVRDAVSKRSKGD